MKRDADRVGGTAAAPWEGGARRFRNRGTDGRWRELLGEPERAEHRRHGGAHAVAELPALAGGGPQGPGGREPSLKRPAPKGALPSARGATFGAPRGW